MSRWQLLGAVLSLSLLMAGSVHGLELSQPQPIDGSIRLGPDDDAAAIVTAAPEGTVFFLVDGNYRGWSVTPRTGQSFIAEGHQVVLDGSIVIDAWARLEDVWVAKIPPGGWNAGEAREGSLALQREDLFIDEQLLSPVDTLKDLRPGRWYRDGTTAYLAENTKGRSIELGFLPHAFQGEASDVVLQGLIVRQYASPAQHGAIEATKTLRWTLIDVSAAHNHSRGLSLGTEMLVEGGTYSWNGQLGIGGMGHDVIVKGAEIAHNNFAGYQHWWEAGGFKITKSDNLKFIANYVHHNDGPGVWLDWDNRDALIEGCLIAANQAQGIQYEASQRGLVKNNIVTRNDQSGFNEGFWGAEILIQNSREIEVINNTVVVQYNAGIGVTQQERGEGDYGEHLAINNRVIDNTIIYLNKSGKSGAWGDHKEDLLHNRTRFDGNRYIIPKSAQKSQLWEYRGNHLNWTDVKDAGWEANGSLKRVHRPGDHEPDYKKWGQTIQ